MGLASQTRKWGASEPRRPGAFAGDSFDALTSVMYFFPQRPHPTHRHLAICLITLSHRRSFTINKPGRYRRLLPPSTQLAPGLGGVASGAGRIDIISP